MVMHLKLFIHDDYIIRIYILIIISSRGLNNHARKEMTLHSRGIYNFSTVLFVYLRKKTLKLE
jgi:hypothetical protein